MKFASALWKQNLPKAAMEAFQDDDRVVLDMNIIDNDDKLAVHTGYTSICSREHSLAAGGLQGDVSKNVNFSIWN